MEKSIGKISGSLRDTRINASRARKTSYKSFWGVGSYPQMLGYLRVALYWNAKGQ